MSLLACPNTSSSLLNSYLLVVASQPFCIFLFSNRLCILLIIGNLIRPTGQGRDPNLFHSGCLTYSGFLPLSIKLDDLELVKKVQERVEEPIAEIRTIYGISVDDERSVVELRIPGAAYNVLQ